jgi:pimeloyl-ACP methyl ester carboxylesterase
MALGLLLLAVVLAALGALLAAAVVALMAWSLLRPPRMTDGKAAWLLQRLSPGDLNMPYEDARFTVRDQRTGEPLRMAAWWIPSPAAPGGKTSDRCAVLLHGYADAKVGAIAWAPVWQKLGFHILALDLRAHGESQGRESTAGYYERHDVDQVISQLRAERPAATRHVVLFGASLGAAVAVATAAIREDLAALVLESPYADFRSAARTHMDLLGLPGGPMQSAALRLAEWLAGANFDEVRPAHLLRSIRCPVLVIAPAEDVFLGAAGTAALELAIAARPPNAGPGEFWRVDAAGHLLGVHADGEAYAERLRSFLDRALGGLPIEPSPPVCPEITVQRE